MFILPVYLLQTGISLLLLFIIYDLFMKNETFFSFNRTYLLLSIMFSLIFPLLRLRLSIPPENGTGFSVLLNAVTIGASKVEQTFTRDRSALEYFTIVYLAGSAIFTVRFLFKIARILGIIRKYGIVRLEGINFVFVGSRYLPFSFFNLIFINRDETNRKNFHEIVAHEKVHIRQMHSLDIILTELLIILQWFNPVVWFYRNSLKSVHEYLADEGVLLAGCSKISYQKALISQTLRIRINDLTNNFNHSLLAKRFIMMTKQKSNRLARLKVMLAVPAAFTLAVLFTLSPVMNSLAQVDKKLKPPKEAPVPPPVPPTPPGLEVLSPESDDDEGIFTMVEKMPEFPGGNAALMKYMEENIKYPEEARKKGIKGNVYVSFIVEKDGKISGVKVLRGIGGGCDEEAVRVIQNMPAWTPGQNRGQAVRTKFNIPLKFMLNDDAPKEQSKDE